MCDGTPPDSILAAYAVEVAPLALRHYGPTYVHLCVVLGHLFGSGIVSLIRVRRTIAKGHWVQLNIWVNDPTEWAWRLPYAIQWIWPVPLLILVCPSVYQFSFVDNR